jgi:hypothetical protein
MVKKKTFRHLDYSIVMHSEDKSTIEWLNGLKVPYVSKLDFLREITKHPMDRNLKEWFEIFKAGVEYYTLHQRQANIVKPITKLRIKVKV